MLFRSGDQVAKQLGRAIAEWRRAYYEGRSRLSFADVGDAIVLVSEREGYRWHTLVIDDSDEIAIFGMLSQPRSGETLAKYALESLSGRVDLPGLLERWQELGIVFSDNGQMIHVAVEARNQELTRVSSERVAARAVASSRFRDEPGDLPQGG